MANSCGGGNGPYSGGVGGGNYGLGGNGGLEVESRTPEEFYGGESGYLNAGYFSHEGKLRNRLYMGGGGVILFSGDKLPDYITTDILSGLPGYHIPSNNNYGATTVTNNTGIIIKKLISPLRGFLFNILENTFTVCGTDTTDPLPATTPKGGMEYIKEYYGKKTSDSQMILNSLQSHGLASLSFGYSPDLYYIRFNC